MITFKIYEASTFYKGPDEELERMFEVLRVKDKNSRFRAQFILKKMGYFYKKRKDMTSDELDKVEKIEESTSYIKFYDKRRKSFGTGLLRVVREHLEKNEIGVELNDRRGKKVRFEEGEVAFHFEDEVETRSEQLSAFRTALHKGCGILHLATNAGKTEIAAMIISAWHLKTGHWPRTLFLIHRASLAHQTQKRFEKHLGKTVACLGGGGDRQLRRITVSTTQTASSLVRNNSQNFLEFLDACDLVFVDELHVNKARSILEILSLCRARMRFGLSGTVDKGNSAKMMYYIGMLGPIISEVRNRELVEKGRSAKPYMRMVFVKTDEVRGDFGKSYRFSIVDNHYRNRLVIKEALRYVDKGYRTMITVARIDHGRIIRDMLARRTEIPVEFMHGGTPLYVRNEIKKKFVRGKIPILIASPIFDVGEDLPEIDAWVNAAGGKGWELVLQRLGRTMRRKEGENKVRITDFIDTHNVYMLKHSAKRLEYYLKENIAKIKIVREVS